MEARNDDAVEDAALARRIMLDRDASAEALLCQRVLPRARAYGLRHLRDAAAASDLAQDVMILLLEALRAGRVEEPDRLAAFTMGICRNTVLQWKTGDRRRQTLLERFGPELASAVGAAPAIVDKDKLALCLDRLGARERTIVVVLVLPSGPRTTSTGSEPNRGFVI